MWLCTGSVAVTDAPASAEGAHPDWSAHCNRAGLWELHATLVAAPFIQLEARHPCYEAASNACTHATLRSR
jgi:hypothetical protein